jgi:hypothetical protein
MSELPEPPEPEPGSPEELDRLTIELCARIEEELLPMLERRGKHEQARRWRIRMELVRLASTATDEQIDTLARLDRLLDEGDDDG